MSQSLTLEEIRKMQQSISLKEVAQLNNTITEYKLSVDQQHELMSAYINGKKKFTRSRILYCLIVYFIILFTLLMFFNNDLVGNNENENEVSFFLWSLYILFIIIVFTKIISKYWWSRKLQICSQDKESGPDKTESNNNKSGLNVHKLAELLFSGDRGIIHKEKISQEELVGIINQIRDDIKKSIEDLHASCKRLIDDVKSPDKK